MAEPDRSPAGLLLEGIALRLQADLRWLEACEQNWANRRMGHERLPSRPPRYSSSPSSFHAAAPV
jgi:hypothetical protein